MHTPKDSSSEMENKLVFIGKTIAKLSLKGNNFSIFSPFVATKNIFTKYYGPLSTALFIACGALLLIPDHLRNEQIVMEIIKYLPRDDLSTHFLCRCHAIRHIYLVTFRELRKMWKMCVAGIDIRVLYPNNYSNRSDFCTLSGSQHCDEDD